LRLRWYAAGALPEVETKAALKRLQRGRSGRSISKVWSGRSGRSRQRGQWSSRRLLVPAVEEEESGEWVTIAAHGRAAPQDPQNHVDSERASYCVAISGRGAEARRLAAHWEDRCASLG
jgi:hypothetical protein